MRVCTACALCVQTEGAHSLAHALARPRQFGLVGLGPGPSCLACPSGRPLLQDEQCLPRRAQRGTARHCKALPGGSIRITKRRESKPTEANRSARRAPRLRALPAPACSLWAGRGGAGSFTALRSGCAAPSREGRDEPSAAGRAQPGQRAATMAATAPRSHEAGRGGREARPGPGQGQATRGPFPERALLSNEKLAISARPPKNVEKISCCPCDSVDSTRALQLSGKKWKKNVTKIVI